MKSRLHKLLLDLLEEVEYCKTFTRNPVESRRFKHLHRSLVVYHENSTKWKRRLRACLIVAITFTVLLVAVLSIGILWEVTRCI